MAHMILQVEQVQYGQLETGLWCSACALPSAVARTVALIHDCQHHGPEVFAWVRVEVCVPCGHVATSQGLGLPGDR